MKELKERCMKKDNPRLQVKFNRFFAIYLTWLFVHTPFTGNQITFMMFLLLFIVFGLFTMGDYWYVIFGLILLHFQQFLDSVDGMIARFKDQTSLEGVFIDLILHSIQGPLVFFGLTLGVYKNTGSMFFLIFGIVAALFSHISSSVNHIKNQIIIKRLVEYAKGNLLHELEGKNFEDKGLEEEIKKEVKKFVNNYLKTNINPSLGEIYDNGLLKK